MLSTGGLIDDESFENSKILKPSREFDMHRIHNHQSQENLRLQDHVVTEHMLLASKNIIIRTLSCYLSAF
jgi:hypothetical protein